MIVKRSSLKGSAFLYFCLDLCYIKKYTRQPIQNNTAIFIENTEFAKKT